jgi:hypothetical protein
VELAVARDLDLEPGRERVDDRDADAVQSARDLVAVRVELAAGVQRGHHDLERRALGLGVQVDRDAAPVVGDRDRVVAVDDDADRVAVAGERLVDRVVHDLVHEVVETADADVADVHRGTLADGLEALQHRDVGRVVVVALLLFHQVRVFLRRHAGSPRLTAALPGCARARDGRP